MNDHNLDDLIIDTIAPKNNKTKSLLTIIALLIVVLIVAIILTKTLLKSPENSELSFEENLSEIIAPELKLQEPTKEIKIAKPKEEPSLSAIIEEKVTAPEEPKETEVIEEVKAPVVVEKEEIAPEKSKEIISEKVVSKPVITKPVVPVKTVPKIIQKPKQTVKKPIKKPVLTHKKPKATVSGTYYVQVGSFKDDPSARFLSVIKSSGFKYHVSKPDRTGYKKLLIGPYKTRADVDKARDVIRDRIHKSAFVVQK